MACMRHTDMALQENVPVGLLLWTSLIQACASDAGSCTCLSITPAWQCNVTFEELAELANRLHSPNLTAIVQPGPQD